MVVRAPSETQNIRPARFECLQQQLLLLWRTKPLHSIISGDQGVAVRNLSMLRLVLGTQCVARPSYLVSLHKCQSQLCTAASMRQQHGLNLQAHTWLGIHLQQQ